MDSILLHLQSISGKLHEIVLGDKNTFGTPDRCVLQMSIPDQTYYEKPESVKLFVLHQQDRCLTYLKVLR